MIFCTIKENNGVMEYRENERLIANAVGEYKVIIYAKYAYQKLGVGYSKSNRILLNPLTVWDGLVPVGNDKIISGVPFIIDHEDHEINIVVKEGMVVVRTSDNVARFDDICIRRFTDSRGYTLRDFEDMASHGAELHPDGKIRIRKTLIKDTENSFKVFRNEWVKHTKNYFKQFGLNVKVSK